MKLPLSLSCLLCIATATLTNGCAGPWSAIDKTTHAHTPGDSEAIAEETMVAESLELAKESPPITPEAALAGVLDELQEIGAIDPAAQQQLMDDLKQTKPEHYTLVVDQFRAALAYRQQMAAREQANQTLAKSGAEKLRDSATLEIADDPHRNAAVSRKRQSEDSPAAQSRQLPQREVALASDATAAPRETLPDDAVHSEFAVSRPLPPPPEKTLSEVDEPSARAAQSSKAAQPANALQPGSLQLEPQLQTASHAAPALPLPQGEARQAGAAAGWSDQLDATITQLKQKVSPQPHTIAEVHLHMRLRALELLAGREEEALRPIPGATPAQQDYWAKQLYALSTFLDEQTYVDAKARAAAALVHLDAARSQLAELATLQVRNLAFVDSADGFGEYKTTEKTKFQPGAQATLYTEVENYRSESTKRGYRTLLTTSYQILDKAGQRVDGGQFPDVEDYCQNRRRDFHMQYNIPLPTRIYAGQYEMQLIITDGLSNKIGQASVPFEIVE